MYLVLTSDPRKYRNLLVIHSRLRSTHFFFFIHIYKHRVIIRLPSIVEGILSRRPYRYATTTRIFRICDNDTGYTVYLYRMSSSFATRPYCYCRYFLGFATFSDVTQDGDENYIDIIRGIRN